MSTTPNLALPYIAPSQAQKHVTHNEALRTLDALVQMSVLSRANGAPPGAPADGERHLVAAAAAGEWSGQSGRIAAFQDGAWRFLEPRKGWIAWVEDEQTTIAFTGSAWVGLASVSDLAVARIGVNTAPDAANRVAVKSDAVLFSHDDVTPGSGHMRHVLNKSAPARTAAQLFQSNWSGRAETGLSGDDDFHIKVSADGADWREALVIDRNSGAVRLPQTPAPLFNLFEDGGRFAGSPESTTPRLIGAYAAPGYISAYNGSALVAGPKFIDNNTDYGGTGGALDANAKALIDKLRDAGYRRYGPEFHTLQITAGAGVALPKVVGGVTHYLVAGTPGRTLPPAFSINYFVCALSGQFAVDTLQAVGQTTYLDGVLVAPDFTIAPADGWKQVTHLFNATPRQWPHYTGDVNRLYATPGAVGLFALPTLCPGHLPMAAGLFHGPVPSLRVWR